jgi:AbrB family looped-hinge helix DNA binding protein
MLVSTLTSKGQATIPARIRIKLGLKPGDKIIFKIHDHEAIISKAEPVDYLYHAALSATLEEWDSPEDDEAYDDL